MPSDARYARLSARIGVCATIAGIRVVPRVIARPFWGWAFFVSLFLEICRQADFRKNLVNKQERMKNDERKTAEHQGGGIKSH